MKLSYLVGSVDRKNISFHMDCLLSTYWKLLSLSYLYSPTMLSNKKLQLISQIAFKFRKKWNKKINRNLSWNNISWGILKLVFKVFAPPLPTLTPRYNSSARFPQLVRPLFLLLDNFVAVPVINQWNILTNSLLVSTMGVIVFRVLLIFFLMFWIKHIVS